MFGVCFVFQPQRTPDAKLIKENESGFYAEILQYISNLTDLYEGDGTVGPWNVTA